jgi:hypothetical protein
LKEVTLIAGTAFCGSSLLNILLDTQGPAIRGLGERSRMSGEPSIWRQGFQGGNIVWGKLSSFGW